MNNNTSLLIFPDASANSVKQAMDYAKARGNSLKARTLALAPGTGFQVPGTLLDRKGQPRSLASIKQSVKKWGASAGRDIPGEMIVFKSAHTNGHLPDV